MAASYEQVATALKTVIDTEFAPESIVAIHDRLHEALGQNRVTVGIAPVRETPRTGNMIELETWVEVRFYDLWDAQIDPEQTVNPFTITRKAERFRQAVQRAQASAAGTPEVWFYDVMGIEYPDDPTGNKTRFIATIRSFGNNTGLLETS